MFRTALLGTALSAGLTILVPAAQAQVPAAASTATQTIDVMDKLWGQHAGMRANHAKGVVVEGSFTPSAEAATLSAASVFKGPAVPVIARFSDGTGLPAIPDGSPDANPHGMALKFHLADGSDMDVVVNSLGIFPVATGEEFRDLLTAASNSGPGVAKPTPVEQFIASHPSVPKAFGTVSTPSSLAREVYNGVDAFVFVDAAGKKQPFRFRFVPVAGIEHLSKDDAAKLAPDALMTELPKRLGTAPVAFKMMAQMANPGDQTKDPTQAWPDDRRMVDMGTLTLTKAVADSDAEQKALRYLPNRLPPGIELSDDPLIIARVQAYLISFGRRAQ